MLFFNYLTLSNLSNYITLSILGVAHYLELRWLFKEHMNSFLCQVHETYEEFVAILSIERTGVSIDRIVKEIQFDVSLIIDQLKQVNFCVTPENISKISQEVDIAVFQWERHFIFNKIRDFINMVCKYLDYFCKLNINQVINSRVLFYANWFLYCIKFVYAFGSKSIDIIKLIPLCLYLINKDLDMPISDRILFYLNGFIHYIKMIYNYFIFALFCIVCLNFLYNFCINLYFRKIDLSKKKIKTLSGKKLHITSIFLKNTILYHLIFYKKFLTKLFSISEKKTFYLINNMAFNRAIFMKILAQKLFSKSKSKVIKSIKIIKLNFIKNFKQNLKEYIIFYHLGIKISKFFLTFNSILFINGGLQKKIINKNDYLNYILQLFLSKFYTQYNSSKIVLGITKNNMQKINKMYKNQNFNTFFILQNVSLLNSFKLLKIKAKLLNHYYSNIQIKVEALNCSLFLSVKCFRYLFIISNAFNLLAYAYKKYIFIFFQKVPNNVLLFFLKTMKILVTIYLKLLKKYSFICILMFNILKKVIKTIICLFLKVILTNILIYCLIKNVEKLLSFMLMKCLFKNFLLNSNILISLHFSLNENEKLLHFKPFLKKKQCFLFDFYKSCLYIYKIWLNFKYKYFHKFFKKLTTFLTNIRLYNKFYRIKKASKIYAFSKLYLYYIFKNYNFKVKNKLIFTLKIIEISICGLKLNMFQNYIINNKILALKKFVKQNCEFYKKNSLKLANTKTFIEKVTFITSKNIFNLVLNFKQTSKTMINFKHMYFNFNGQTNIFINKTYNLFMIKKILQKYILGQDNIILFLLNLLKFSKQKNYARIDNQNTLLFYGLKHVGKTQVVKALSIGLFNSTKYLSIYNMFYYMNKLSIKFLIHEYYNIPKFFFTKNKNNLILILKRIGSSLIYLKNIEKAHPYLLNIFINILKNGYFKDINNYKICLTGNFIIFSLKYSSLWLFKNRRNIQQLKIKKYKKRLVLDLQRKLYKKKFLTNILIKFVAKMHKICKIAIFKILVKIIIIKIFNSFLSHFAKYLLIKNIQLNVENNVRRKIICYNKLKTINLKFLVIIIIIKPILIKLFKYSLLSTITILLKKRIQIIYNA